MAKLNGNLNGWLKVAVLLMGLIGAAFVIRDDLGETIVKVDAQEMRLQECEKNDVRNEEHYRNLERNQIRMEDKLDALTTQVSEALRTSHSSQ